jgi:hypothetical protein
MLGVIVLLGSSIQKTVAGGRLPEGWQAAGDKAVLQELTAQQDPKRGHVARLRCTQFVPGTPSSHAMIAQFGHVAVQSGRWYRLSLWARASDLEAGVVQLNMANFRNWSSVGLSGSFVPSEDWQRFEFVFQAERDLKPADSRLAIYFLSTGTLWLDDVAIEETAPPKRQWLPAIPIEGLTNALPNSSFEGGEGWGCSAGRYYDWTANLFQRIGQWDDSQAFHGKRSWKVTLSPSQPLMLYGGYTQLAAEVRTLELGHAGWVRVEPGRPCVFSVYVKSDRTGAPVSVGLKEPEDWRRSNHRTVSIGQQWQRIEVSYTPKGEFLRGCLGFDLPEGEKEPRTLWIDAAQFERGTLASPYHPRAELEAGIETGVVGNLFTDPSKGLCFQIRAFNDSKEPKVLRGRLRVTDPACQAAVRRSRQLLQETWAAIHVQPKYLAASMWPSEEFDAIRWRLATETQELLHYPATSKATAPSVLIDATALRPAQVEAVLPFEQAAKAGKLEALPRRSLPRNAWLRRKRRTGRNSGLAFAAAARRMTTCPRSL